MVAINHNFFKPICLHLFWIQTSCGKKRYETNEKELHFFCLFTAHWKKFISNRTTRKSLTHQTCIFIIITLSVLNKSLFYFWSYCWWKCGWIIIGVRKEHNPPGGYPPGDTIMDKNYWNNTKKFSPHLDRILPKMIDLEEKGVLL